MNKEMKPLLYIVAGIAVLGVLLYLDGFMQPAARDISAPPKASPAALAPTQQSAIVIGQMVLGCGNASTLKALDDFRAEGNKAAYDKMKEFCRPYQNGDVATVDETDDFNRAVKITRKGDFIGYWVHSYDVVIR